MKPIRRVHQLLNNNSLLLGVNSEKLNKALGTIDNTLIPFMNSIQKEFNVNSGKTLKDQLTRIEDNLMLNDARIKTFTMNFSEIGFYECDPAGRCVWVNRAMSEIWGREKQELLGAGWLSGILEDDREEVWDKWQYSIIHRTPYEADYTIINAESNERIKVRTRAICLVGADGVVMSYLGHIVRI